MVAVLTVAGLTVSGSITPLMLLILTFALSAGDAFKAPTWRALLPELVPKEDLPAAASLNGIEFNLARAVGPGLAGMIIAIAGVGTAFLLNAISFFGVIVAIARWKRVIRQRTTPPETVAGRYGGGNPVYPLLARHSQPADSLGVRPILCRGPHRPAASRRESSEKQTHCLWNPARMLWLGCGARRLGHAACTGPPVGRGRRLYRCCDPRSRHRRREHVSNSPRVVCRHTDRWVGLDHVCFPDPWACLESCC